MVNKMEGFFNHADEESFKTFAIYCGLALHHAKVSNYRITWLSTTPRKG